MTRNNLDGHVRWLLSTKPVVPRSSIALQPPTEDTSTPPTHTQFVAEFVEDADLLFEEQQSVEVAAEGGRSGTGNNNDTMARLRTAPTPSRKPVLVSQVSPASFDSPRRAKTTVDPRQTGECFLSRMIPERVRANGVP